MSTKPDRDVKEEATSMIRGLIGCVEDIRYRPEVTYEPRDEVVGRHRLECTLENGGAITYEMLSDLGNYFDTRDISFTNTEQGYYGDHEEAKLVIILPVGELDRYLVSAKATKERERKRQKAYDARRKADIKQQAEKVGFKVSE